MKIPDEHVLPCDFICGHMRFRKGVKLETVRKAAERWLKAATKNYFTEDPELIKRVDALLALPPNDQREEGK